MRRPVLATSCWLLFVVLAAAWASLSPVDGQGRDRAAARVWTFDDMAVDMPPAGFEIGTPGAGSRADGRWLVVDDGHGHVLAQVNGTAGAHRVIVAQGSSFGDVSLSVRFKGTGGDRAAGLVWRYTNGGDHYLARLNLSQQRASVFKVVRGTRSRIAGLDDLELDVSAWHTLKAEHRGDLIRVWLNGIPVAETRDRTIEATGRVGVWTSPASTAWFDDLRAAPLRR